MHAAFFCCKPEVLAPAASMPYRYRSNERLSHERFSPKLPGVYGVSGVLGVIKRRIGAKFDDARQVWVFGLLRSRNLHVEATDINMTGETDLRGVHPLRDRMAYHKCIETYRYLRHELLSSIQKRLEWLGK